MEWASILGPHSAFFHDDGRNSLYISWRNREAKGVGWAENFRHVAIRCFKLFLCGTALHCIYAGKLVWELWNVLTQLSVTTILAYLVIRKSSTVQIVYSLGLLLLTELLYRFTNVPGYDQPFVDHKNFGAFMDMVLMGKINEGGWVTINFIPTAAHTIWGVVAGKLLMGNLISAKENSAIADRRCARTRHRLRHGLGGHNTHHQTNCNHFFCFRVCRLGVPDFGLRVLVGRYQEGEQIRLDSCWWWE